ncbi:DNA repair protein recO [Haloferula helveola]|uniref:DNA repair protein RecO n=1 Tax=Haloferula helveola TaxID=490095 RepID=A0ABM7REI5_9BACT|nr:DNA repair protein recO [Haloferula helveola]
MESSDAILTRLTKLTDTSLIVHWFTESCGLIKTVAKGARRPKSPFAGKLDLFFSAEVHWAEARRGELHSLREVSPQSCRERIRRDYPTTLLAAYFCRLLETAVEHQHPEPELYDLLRRGLDHINASGASENALFHFESELARLLGLGNEKRRGAPALREALGGLPNQREQVLASFDNPQKIHFPDHKSEV